ncbi:hypothetical protein HYV79_03685 [Candidatus Woesearchaeota archaeon]|nr:hypothetical protein [Candidatus Woesearchaeota archaeon]
MPKEISENEIIQFVGLKDLSAPQQVLVNSLATAHYDKLKRELNNLTSMVIHIKYYKKEGEKQKYSLHVRCIAPTKIFESCKSHDWDLARAMHKSFEDLRRQIEHSLHNNTSWKKSYE